MPIYLFFSMDSPNMIHNEIHNIKRRFLCSRGGENQKWEFVKWDNVYKPQIHGGLILRNPEKMNVVGGTEIWWCWVTYDSKA